MKILKMLLYFLVLIVVILGIFKIFYLKDKLEKIKTFASSNNGYYYPINPNVEVIDFNDSIYYLDESENNGIMYPGDGENKRQEIQNDIIKSLLVFGIGAIVILVFAISLKTENLTKENSIKDTELENHNHISEKPTSHNHINTNKMENHFDKGIEYNELAKCFNATYLMLQDVKNEMLQNSNPQNLFLVCLLVRNEVLDRIEKYNWNMQTPIFIPMMPLQNKTLIGAVNMLMENVKTCGDYLECIEECYEILQKKEFYYTFNEKVPQNIKNMLK